MRALSLALLVALAVTLACQAQQVHRCRTADGVALFTDQPCSRHGAIAVAAPEPIGSVAELPWHDARRGALAAGLPEAALGCPAPDIETLLSRLQQAVDAHDLNALAGLYHWNGAGTWQARQVLARLRGLFDGAVDARIESARLDSARLDSTRRGATAAMPENPDRLQLAIYPDAGAFDARTRFALVADAGCVWLSG